MLNILSQKKCSRCKDWKNRDNFGADKRSSDGLKSECKACAVLATRDWKVRNPEKNRELQRQWEIIRPKEVRSEDARKRYWGNLEKYRESGRVKWSNRRAKIKQVGGSISGREWSELKKKYNYTCLACGRREPEIKLSHDHVKPISMGGANTIENSQPLCKSCNSIKGTKWIDYR
jgi:5-methylcytosine-specific restriction endonuclease McrA